MVVVVDVVVEVVVVVSGVEAILVIPVQITMDNWCRLRPCSRPITSYIYCVLSYE